MSNSFGGQIKAVRVRRGLSQVELAKIARVSQAAIGQWERGTFVPKKKHAIALESALNYKFSSYIAADAGTVPDIEQCVVASVRIAEHRSMTHEFEASLLKFLAENDEHVRAHAVIEGLSPTNRWIIDCVTSSSIIEIAHPESYEEIEVFSLQILWKLSVFRALAPQTGNFIGVVRRPPVGAANRAGELELISGYEKKFTRLVFEASVVGMDLLVVESPAEAAKKIEEIQRRRRSDSERKT